MILLSKLKSRNCILWFFLVISLAINQGVMASASLQTAAPRYVPGVISILQSHEYIRTHETPLYWKLSPYYIHQRNDISCSLATATMIVNAALAGQTIHAKQQLATQDDILNRVKDKDWAEGVRVNGDGVTLDQLKLFLAKALEAYGINNFTIELVRAEDSSEQTAAKLHEALLNSEKDGQSFIIANFDQKFFTGDVSVGHFAPVGAYDAKNKRVLIMDPDRTLYEPYWVPEEIFLKAMATSDTDAQKHRGYLVVNLK
ncbi:phytochelatin synthase family protein [Legionella brunensis]|uniref:glutathione gamma-glutamylcysteinyltransferase n=1 Tax=Legionella brunensis TaxID=29422 RepID=A0A0W0SUH1_9GAMM|nr:phytochelatin synthase family protein [Legionella brunensis]KTC86597.1 Phytochelatin synthase [Legionella brunensis]